MIKPNKYLVINNFEFDLSGEIKTNGLFSVVEKIDVNHHIQYINANVTWKTLLTDSISKHCTYYLTTNDLRTLKLVSSNNNVILVSHNIKNDLKKFAKAYLMAQVNKCFDYNLRD